MEECLAEQQTINRHTMISLVKCTAHIHELPFQIATEREREKNLNWTRWMTFAFSTLDDGLGLHFMQFDQFDGFSFGNLDWSCTWHWPYFYVQHQKLILRMKNLIFEKKNCRLKKKNRLKKILLKKNCWSLLFIFFEKKLLKFNLLLFSPENSLIWFKTHRKSEKAKKHSKLCSNSKNPPFDADWTMHFDEKRSTSAFKVNRQECSFQNYTYLKCIKTAKPKLKATKLSV